MSHSVTLKHTPVRRWARGKLKSLTDQGQSGRIEGSSKEKRWGRTMNIILRWRKVRQSGANRRQIVEGNLLAPAGQLLKRSLGVIIDSEKHKRSEWDENGRFVFRKFTREGSADSTSTVNTPWEIEEPLNVFFSFHSNENLLNWQTLVWLS